MNRKRKVLFFLMLIISIGFVPFNKVFAKEPMLSIYPEGGVVKNVGEGFTIDVLLDSGDYDIAQARFAIKFDPSVVQIRKASRNESLFQQWPDDESSLDNESGLVMLTGFTQSGSAELYSTDGDPDVMARLEFDIVSDTKEDILFSFEYDGTDSLFKSSILKDGSPPQNVLGSRPEAVTFTMSDFKHVETAVDFSTLGIVIGLILISVGVFVTSTKTTVLRKKKGTIVLYD